MSRLKAFGFRRDKKINHIPTSSSPTPPPANLLVNSNSNGTASPPPSGDNTSSTHSLPMQNNQFGRPPSYPVGRPTSPMVPGQQQLGHHPPPINTNLQYGQQPVQQMNPPPAYGMQQVPHGIPQNMSQPGYAGRVTTDADGGRGKAQLIVGIDFGTTFSGVAFAFATNNEAREDIITEWPGAGTHTKQKVNRTLPPID